MEGALDLKVQAFDVLQSEIRSRPGLEMIRVNKNEAPSKRHVGDPPPPRTGIANYLPAGMRDPAGLVESSVAGAGAWAFASP